jgi:hypothetical protein
VYIVCVLCRVFYLLCDSYKNWFFFYLCDWINIANAGCNVVVENFLLSSVLIFSLLCIVGYCNYFLILLCILCMSSMTSYLRYSCGLLGSDWRQWNGFGGSCYALVGMLLVVELLYWYGKGVGAYDGEQLGCLFQIYQIYLLWRAYFYN